MAGTAFEAHYNYTTVIDTELLCPWCSDPLQNPNVLSDCDHTFCRKCIDDLLTTQNHDSDHLLNDNDDAKSDTDSVIEARLNGQETRPSTNDIIICPSCEHESNGFLPAPDIKSHVDNLLVKCVKCLSLMPRLHFAQHWMSECTSRFTACGICNAVVPRVDWEAHERGCKGAFAGSVPADHHQWQETRAKVAGTVRFEDIEEIVPRSRETEISSTTSQENDPPTPPVSVKGSSNRFTYLENGRELRPGVIFEYFQGEWNALPDFDKLPLSNAGEMSTFSINVNTESSVLAKSSTDSGLLDAGNFAVRFTAFINVPQTGQYTFYLSSNDGSALYIQDTKVVDNDGQHYSREAEGKIDLIQGTHHATVLFFHRNGKHLESYRSGPFLSVSYYCPGPGSFWVIDNNAKQILTKEHLFYDYEDSRTRELLNFKPAVKPTKTIDLTTRELKGQLEVANATINDLIKVNKDQSESSEDLISSLKLQLQQEREQTHAIKLFLQANRMFDDGPSYAAQAGTERRHAGRGQTVSVYMDAQSELDLSIDEYAGLEHQPIQEMLQKHQAEVDRVKQMYFFSIALSIKMNMQLLGKALPPNLTVQRLYEEIVVERKVSLKSWANEVSLYLATRTN